MPHDDFEVTRPTSELGFALEALLNDNATIGQMELLRDTMKIRRVINDDDGSTFKAFILDNKEPQLSQLMEVLKANSEDFYMSFNGNEFYMMSCSAREFLVNPDQYIDIRKATAATLRGEATPEQIQMLSEFVEVRERDSAHGEAVKFDMHAREQTQIAYTTEAEAEATMSHAITEQGVIAALKNAVRDVTGQNDSPVLSSNVPPSFSPELVHTISVEVTRGAHKQLAGVSANAMR